MATCINNISGKLHKFILFISVIPVFIVYNKVKAQKRQLVAQTLREKTSQTDI